MSLTKVTYSMISGAYVNVLDFGADPTGVADSAAAIQAACDFAWNVPASTGRKVVYFPNGEYRVNTTITIAGISLLGESMSGSVIKYYGSNACLSVSTGENWIYNLLFNGSNADAGSSVGIQYNTTIRHTLRFCTIRDFYRGIKIQGTASFNNLFSENSFYSNGIHVYTNPLNAGQFPTDTWFLENEFNGSTDPNFAIYLEDSEGFTFERNTLQGNLSKYTILVNYVSNKTNPYMNHRIINNWFEENGNSQVGSADIWVNGSFGAVQGILIQNNQHYTTNANNPTYGIRAFNTDGLTVQNNTWNLISPFVYIYKEGTGNKNWVVSNPLVSAKQEMKQHQAVLAKLAGSAQTIAAGANDVILFNGPLDNASGLWNTSTGEFTCAAKGVYAFQLTMHIDGSAAGEQFELTALVNGSTLSPALTMTCIKQVAGNEAFTFMGYVTCDVVSVITFKCKNFTAGNRVINVNSQGMIKLVDYIR